MVRTKFKQIRFFPHHFVLGFRYSDILLRRVSAGHICFSQTLKSFVSLTAEGAIPFNAEEFSDPTELRALTELIGWRTLQAKEILF